MCGEEVCPTSFSDSCGLVDLWWVFGDHVLQEALAGGGGFGGWSRASEDCSVVTAASIVAFVLHSYGRFEHAAQCALCGCLVPEEFCAEMLEDDQNAH